MNRVDKSIVSVAAIIFLALALVTPAAAQSYNAVADFSASVNPNGAWSYGWSASRGSAFNLSGGFNY